MSDEAPKLNKRQQVFIDEYLMFPTKNVHDDLLDALAYIDQLAVTSYAKPQDDEDYEILDVTVGF